MPRVYKRKHEDYGKTPADVMQKAIDDVLVNGKKVREAAKDHGIPRGTLRSNLKKAAQQNTTLVPNYQHSRIFSDAQEDVLAEYAVNCAQMFHGLTTKTFRSLAYSVAKANSMHYPPKWDEEKMAGKEWYLGFMRRHPQLSIRQPEATSLARASAFNRHTIENYFNLLESSYREMAVTGAQIFNLDETGITTVHKVPKVIAPKGVKQMGQVTSGERGELVTMCCIVSATGQALPPVFIFPRKNYRDLMLSGAPEGSLGLAYPSGWMTSENFVRVIDHIVKHVRPSESYPIIVTMDNHESHIAYGALEKAKANHVRVITLPPHTSNKTQPLDRTVFGPLKAAFNKNADAWMLQNPGKTITIYQLAELGGSAFVKAATPTNICSGFRVSGMWPLDKDAFNTDEFMPASVTDRPEPQASSLSEATLVSAEPTLTTSEPMPTTSEPTPTMSEPMPTTSEPTPTTSEPMPTTSEPMPTTSEPMPTTSEPTPCTSEPMPTTSEPTPTTSEPTPTTSEPMPTTSEPTLTTSKPMLTLEHSISSGSAGQSTPKQLALKSFMPEDESVGSPAFISPVDLRGYPKAPPRKESTRGRKRGKSMVATSTPEMKRIQLQQEEALNKKEKKKSATAPVKKLFVELEDDDPASDISLTDLMDESDDESDGESGVLKLDVVENVRVGDYVVVEFAQKSSKCYYVGRVTQERDEDDDFEVDFLRRKGGYFVKPVTPDVSSVHIDNVKAVLEEPTVRGTTQRTKGELVFSVNFGTLNLR